MAKTQMLVRLEQSLKDKVIEEAKKQDLSVNTLVKLILQDYFKLR